VTYPQPIESAQVSLFVSGGRCAKESGLRRRANANPALNINAVKERQMSLIPDKAGFRPAQPITDPLILQARFVNEAAALDRALAMRKALRPLRSDAAKRGWAVRRG
jgi:hypothetical protein